MKRFIACSAIGLCLALPSISQARDHYDHDRRDDRGSYDQRGYDQRNRYDGRDHRDNRYDNRGHYAHHGDPVRFIGHVIALPFIVVGAVVGAAATVVAAPFNAHYYAQSEAYDQPRYGQVYPAQQPYYAPPPPQVYYADPQYSYAPPQPVYRGY